MVYDRKNWKKVVENINIHTHIFCLINRKYNNIDKINKLKHICIQYLGFLKES